MKIIKSITLVLIGLLASSFIAEPTMKSSDLIGAWKTASQNGEMGLWIFTQKHFSVTYYKSNEFLYTEGGEWKSTPKEITLMWEYNTQKPEMVGTSKNIPVNLKGNNLTIAETSWQRVDDGTPGQLAGAWLITGRYQEGELSERTPGARRTMKILSGTKFQWIAYNVETKEFSGTGGGSYTTKDGKYTEKIEFFSRDNSRVGASLEFDYKIEDGKWRHSGKSSKGDPLDEVWTKREVLGI